MPLYTDPDAVFPVVASPLQPIFDALWLQLAPKFGAVLLFLVVVGLALIAMYFIESNFRRSVNILFWGTPDGSGAVARRGGRPSQWRSGWYKTDSGDWRYFDRDGEDGWAAEASYYRRRRAYLRRIGGTD